MKKDTESVQSGRAGTHPPSYRASTSATADGPELASPATPPERAADRSPASGTVDDLATVAKATLGRIPKVKQPKSAPDPSGPIARLQKAAKRAKDEGDLTQAEKFAQAARDLGCDDDDEAFKGVLRKLAEPRSD